VGGGWWKETNKKKTKVKKGVGEVATIGSRWGKKTACKQNLGRTDEVWAK